MSTIAQPIQYATIFPGLSGSMEWSNSMLNQFLLRLRSFSLGYGTLSIIYLIYGLYTYTNVTNDDEVEKLGTLELLISFFFIMASILLFRISIPANVSSMTKIFLFRY